MQVALGLVMTTPAIAVAAPGLDLVSLQLA